MAQPSTASSIVLAIKGLFLNPSTFGGNAPTGALSVADNVVIDRPSVVATRRGMDNSFSTVPTNASSMFQFNGTKLLYGTDSKLYADVANNGSFVAYTGSYTVPDDTESSSRVRGLESNKNFYYITGEGTYRLDNVSNQPRLAGSPPGLSGSGVTSGVTGFLPASTAVAYRVVFGYRDSNKQLVLGAPSSRIIVTNSTANSVNATITFQVPKEIQTGASNYFYQLYRGHASPDLSTEPDDELALCFEANCTATATMTVTDTTAEALLGASLYTNQGQEGILQSNYRPPWAVDVCTFKQYAFYANTRTIHSADITLTASGALGGADAIIPGDTITFTATELGGASFTMTAVSGANNTATGQFNVSNTGVAATDIQTTASNIALVANGYAANTFLAAYYVSTGNDQPGQMRFDRITLNKNSFTFTSSRNSAWEQVMPISSTNEDRPNRIYYSKFNQPEAVPLVNYMDVGSANAAIDRIVPLRDGVMVLKQDGVFRISNATTPFTITPIDYGVRMLAPNTAAELDNKVYFLSDQGVVALSDSDTQLKSFVLDRTIIENTSPDLFPNLQATAWGIAYHSDRKYILSMPTAGFDAQSTQQYVYNHLTDVWTRWTLAASCGLVFKNDGKLYLGSVGSAPAAGSSYVYQERKSFTETDYADNEYITTNITSGQTDVIVINNPTLPPGVTIQPGWSITQFNLAVSARVLSVTSTDVTTTLVLDRLQNWSTAPVTIYVPVYTEVETVQMDCNNPGMNKQFSEVVYVFTEQGFSQLTVSTTSDTARIPVVDYITPQHRGGWGVDLWGTSSWGGGVVGQGKVRRYIPRAVQRAGWLYFNITNAEAFKSFGLSGIEVFYKATSSRQF